MPAFTPVHDLPLPEHARLDLARFTIVTILNPGAVQRANYLVPGDVICVVEAVSLTLTTGGLAGNRGMIMSMRDQDLVDTMRVATPFDHPASTARQYNFLSTVASVQGPYGFDYMSPVPPAIGLPGYTISFFVTAWQAPDAMSNIRLSCIHVPTGPELPSLSPPRPLALT